MLNYIWAAMILIGIVVSAFTGKLDAVTTAVLDSSREAITVCIAMLGAITMWTGMMQIGERSGLIKRLSAALSRPLSLLFPDIPKKSKAMEYISTNFIANILGLGWAATPAGLKAMEELQKYNHDKERASRSMIMFLIINMSSLQLITMNLIVYRTQYNSANPIEIIGPGILATLVSTVAAIAVAIILERVYGK